MEKIQALFERMDDWRHLPNYQLERRADLFFSLYLPEALESKLGFPVSERIIPEFPVRIGTIYPNIPIDKSYKVDYVALSVDGTTAILVELKTEGLSRRSSQDKYLEASRKAGFPALVSGVLDIFRATDSKRKYFALLRLFESMGILLIPDELKKIMSRSNIQGADEASRAITIQMNVTNLLVVYIQPSGEGEHVISFEDFRAVVEKHEDMVSRRFALSLSEWASTNAGDRVSTGAK